MVVTLIQVDFAIEGWKVLLVFSSHKLFSYFREEKGVAIWAWLLVLYMYLDTNSYAKSVLVDKIGVSLKNKVCD